MDGTFLDWALATFSGYVAADELYEGPYCVLSVVDNRQYKRITTDGSALYPEPIRTVFGEVAHQICTFHVLKELTQGILSAVAAERTRLAQSKPKVKRGRPASQDQVARRLARPSKQMQAHIRGLFQERFVLVKRRLKPSERKRLVHITRGLPQLRKLHESYGLYLCVV